MGKKYIHYGSPKFVTGLFRAITNCDGFNKPRGGLWASPVDAERSWREWVEGNNFYPETLATSFEFELSAGARVLELTPENVWDLPEDEKAFMKRDRRDRNVFSMVYGIDFEALAREYDVLECSLSRYPSLYWSLYGWDCDSILIMNPDVIVEV